MSRYPNFRFFTISGSNTSYDYYNDGGSSSLIRDVGEACKPESIDLCISTSLFTHLNPTESRTNLRAIASALKQDGVAFITAFVVDRPTRWIMKGGRSVFQFETIAEPGCYFEKADDPRYAVAYELDRLGGLLADEGLYIEKCMFGSWPGRHRAATMQDILIVRRLADKPWQAPVV
jgi:hypothetical protein